MLVKPHRLWRKGCRQEARGQAARTWWRSSASWESVIPERLVCGCCDCMDDRTPRRGYPTRQACVKLKPFSRSRLLPSLPHHYKDKLLCRVPTCKTKHAHAIARDKRHANHDVYSSHTRAFHSVCWFCKNTPQPPVCTKAVLRQNSAVPRCVNPYQRQRYAWRFHQPSVEGHAFPRSGKCEDSTS